MAYNYYSRYPQKKLVPRKQMWAAEEALSVEDRRERYRCGRGFTTLEDYKTWDVYIEELEKRQVAEKEAYEQELERRRKERESLEKERLEKERLAREKEEQERVEKERLERERLEKEQKEREEQERLAKERAERGECEPVVEGKAEADSPAEAAPENKEEAVAENKAEKEEEDKKEKEAKKKEKEDTKPGYQYGRSMGGGGGWGGGWGGGYSRVPREPDPPKEPLAARFAPDDELNKMVSLWRGDITSMEIDGIVNAANSSLLGGGGIDGAIHRAAGGSLYDECKQLNGCHTGGCKISRGYSLPAKFVLHTVGPIGEHAANLRACYINCLKVAVANGVRSIAFCGISTGIYGYPLYAASEIALKTVRKWLDTGDNRTKFDRVIFCVFLAKELDCYEHLMPAYFPKLGTPFTPPATPEEEEEVEVSGSSEDEEEEEDEKEPEAKETQAVPDNAEEANPANLPQGITAAAAVAGGGGFFASNAAASEGAAGALVESVMDAEDEKAKSVEGGISLLSGAAGEFIIGAAEAEAARAEAAGVTGEAYDSSDAVAATGHPESGVDTEQLPLEERKTRLARKLAHRQDVARLLDQNILRDPRHISPRLQASKSALEREHLLQSLENKLDCRPTREELVERNVLRPSNVAPALLATQHALEKEQLLQTLEHKLETRHSKAELMQANIIPEEGNLAPTLAATAKALKKENLMNFLDRHLEDRPQKEELIQKHVMRDSNLSPSVQAIQDTLELEHKKNELSKNLEHRPEKEALLERGVLLPDQPKQDEGS